MIPVESVDELEGKGVCILSYCENCKVRALFRIGTLPVPLECDCVISNKDEWDASDQDRTDVILYAAPDINELTGGIDKFYRVQTGAKYETISDEWFFTDRDDALEKWKELSESGEYDTEWEYDNGKTRSKNDDELWIFTECEFE